MVIRKLAALAVFAVLALGSASASATTALRTDPGGGLLSGSTVRNNDSDPLLIATQAGTVTCNETFLDWDVNSNTSPTSITGKLTKVTFTTCTDTILAVNILDCTLATGSVPTVTITAGASGGTVALGDTIVRCATSTPFKACYYTSASSLGNGINATNTIGYANVGVTGITTGFTDGTVPVNCGTSGSLGVTLTGIFQGAGANVVTITQS
jgi:hypothetical protein